uniref:Nucleolin 1 n=1 Tax=Noccaea caerulescens TaxID=107243 RepID=A0A1J3I262_NOCCA
MDATSPTSPSGAMPVTSAYDYAANIKPWVPFCVKGYDTSLPDDDIKKALSSHFISCGEICSISISRDLVTNDVDRSCAFVVIRGKGVEEKALALNGSDLGGWNVSVVKAGTKQKTREEVEAFNAVYYDKNRRFGISLLGNDTSLPEDELKTALKRDFASCGEILHVYIPRYDRGTAYLYFSEEEAIAKALAKALELCRPTFWGEQRPQAKLIALPLTNYASLQRYGGSPQIGCTIPPHVLEWTIKKRTVDK